MSAGNPILKALQRIGARRPYFDILGADGSLYMGRWWLFGGSGFSLDTGDPRDDRTLAQRGWKRTGLDAAIGMLVAARLHHIAREDRARDFHTHPVRWFISYIAAGWYVERVPLNQNQPPELDATHYRDIVRRAGTFAFRRGSDRHTITKVSPGGAWTVFIMGPKDSSWGFWTKGGFINWRNYKVSP